MLVDIVLITHWRSCATSHPRHENVFNGLVAAFLWFTVLFANFARP